MRAAKRETKKAAFLSLLVGLLLASCGEEEKAPVSYPGQRDCATQGEQSRRRGEGSGTSALCWMMCNGNTSASRRLFFSRPLSASHRCAATAAGGTVA